MALEQMNFLSWNMQAGIGTRKYSDYFSRFHENILPAKKNNRLLSLSNEIKKFDVIGLQECDQGSWRSGGVNQGEFLAKHFEFPSIASHISRKFSSISGSGLGVLSKHPILWSKGHRIPSKIPGRGALEVQIAPLNNHSFRVLVVHFSLGFKDQLQQMIWVKNWASTLKTPYVVMGDFNVSPLNNEKFSMFIQNIEPLNHFPQSYPSWNPKKSIDHMLVNGFNAELPKTYDFGISDHLALTRKIWIPRTT